MKKEKKLLSIYRFSSESYKIELLCNVQEYITISLEFRRMTSIVIKNFSPYTTESLPNVDEEYMVKLETKPEWYLRVLAGYPIVDGICEIPDRESLIEKIGFYRFSTVNRFLDKDISEIYRMAKNMDIEQILSFSVFDERFYYYFQDMEREELVKKFLVYIARQFYRYHQKDKKAKLELGNNVDNFLILEERKLCIKADSFTTESVVCTKRLKIHETTISGIPETFSVFDNGLADYIDKKLDITSPDFYCILKNSTINDGLKKKIEKKPLVPLDI